MIFNNPLDICDYYIYTAVKKGDTVIDATVGNGNDTLKLSNAVGEKGKVYGFDIQSEAINIAKGKAYKYDNVIFLNKSHEDMNEFVYEKVSAVFFNLGYLPGGNHMIATTPETTVKAIKEAMKLLADEGIIVIVIYRGGDSGFSESSEVLKFLKSIDYRRFTVLLFDYINRPKNPPMVAVIQKRSVN